MSLPTIKWARSRGLAIVAPGHEASDEAVTERAASFLLVRPTVE